MGKFPAILDEPPSAKPRAICRRRAGDVRRLVDERWFRANAVIGLLAGEQRRRQYSHFRP